jgi:uncharacterized membrane protein YfcA
VTALALGFGLLIGAVVGTVGGGGAILALPVLVYVLGEPVGPASTASLIVIAVAAAVGAGARAREGQQLCWRIARAFAVPAAAGSLAGALANEAVSARALVLSFVPVMLVAAAATWRRAGTDPGGDDPGCPEVPWPKLAGGGLAVGVLTGFFGVGGGFMIVPVLTLWYGVGFRRAVATSLVIITLTGAAALASHLLAGAAPPVGITAALALTTMAGALGGSAVAGRLPQAALGRAFAIVVAALAVFLLVDVLALGGPPT